MRFQTAALTCVLTFFVNTHVLAQEREWVLDAAGEEVFLVFGVSGTADVGVSFWCKLGSREVNLFAPLPKGLSGKPPRKISLLVGPKTYPLRAKRAKQADLQTIEAKLVPQQIILDGLRESDSFEMMIGTHKAVYPLDGADFDGLLKLCNQDSVAPEN